MGKYFWKARCKVWLTYLTNLSIGKMVIYILDIIAQVTVFPQPSYLELVRCIPHIWVFLHLQNVSLLYECNIDNHWSQKRLHMTCTSLQNAERAHCVKNGGIKKVIDIIHGRAFRRNLFSTAKPQLLMLIFSNNTGFNPFTHFCYFYKVVVPAIKEDWETQKANKAAASQARYNCSKSSNSSWNIRKWICWTRRPLMQH